MAQTAVHFLIEQLTAIGQLEIPEGSNVVTSIIQQANEIFEGQIVDAFEMGQINVYENHTIDSDDYYQLNFKSE